MKDTVVIIPVYNEEDSIGLVLDNIPLERIIKVIVVNNASTDSTVEKSKREFTEVVDQLQRGYGSACLKGIESCHKYNPKYVAFLDGDFSDSPTELNQLLSEIDKGFDLVIGSRVRGNNEPGALLPQAVFGNWLATRMMKYMLGGFEFTDLGPFRIIRYQSLLDIKMEDQDFGWTVEMQGKALVQKLKCSEIPVSYKKRIGVSKITGTLKGTILAGQKIIFTILKIWKNKFSQSF
ncbi:MAG: glycosyltransferase family 2 protein [Oligoflexia bacterium]|nr:glycosyltransferase family 2 protein [Oligoflexia bacterium]